MQKKTYVPNILLCGDKEEFFSQIGDRPVNIVAQISFSGVIDGKEKNFLEEKKFFMNGNFYNIEILPPIIRDGDIDYFVYTNLWDFQCMQETLEDKTSPYSKMISLREFKNMSDYTLHDINSEGILLSMERLKAKKILDFNAYFLKSPHFTKCFCYDSEIDCIFDGDIPLIKENIYSHVYKKFSDCKFKHYDYAIISTRSLQEFVEIFQTLSNCDAAIVYVLHHSIFEESINSIMNDFEEIGYTDCNPGKWFFFYRKKPPEDFAIYVVTHKKLPPEHVENLPKGYKLIHAGREISEDFGYLGDDSGENISHLNPYLNEITALYWMWKNTFHTIIGLSHYRRFFTEAAYLFFSHEKILTAEKALDILKNYDIILTPVYDSMMGGFEMILNNRSSELVTTGLTVIEKNLAKVHPDYLDALEKVMNSRLFYRCNMFITRRDIFDAYCKWLFSFIIDATQEFWNNFNFDETDSFSKRTMGHFAERMMTVWLLKNNLRIKELEITTVKEI